MRSGALSRCCGKLSHCLGLYNEPADESDVIQRRYVHGTQRIDERAVLLVGAGEELDSYYYLLQELDTVTGLMNEFGALIEAYTYDAYGQDSWGLSDSDLYLVPRGSKVPQGVGRFATENRPGG